MNTDTPETDKFFATFADGEYAPSHAEYYARLQDLERERDEWKAKYIQQNKDLGCEQMDPNGTIWDHAKTLQRERDEARDTVEFLTTTASDLLTALGNARNERDEALSLEAMYQKVVAACLRCGPIPACQREDGQLEPPWEVIDRIRCERDEARATCGELVTDSDAITLARTVVCITQERDEARGQRDRLAEALNMIYSACQGEGWTISELQACCSSHCKEALQSLTPNQP